MMPTRRILFVDDEVAVLDGIRRTLRNQSPDWELEFACSGQAALSMMSERDFDVIVADLHMPEMNGVELLEIARRCHPQTIRLMFTGHSGADFALRSVAATHQFLAKPCNKEELTAAIDRSCALRSFLNNKQIERVVGQITSLPALPSTYNELMHVLSEEPAQVSTVVRIVQADIGVTAKLLQLVNSAFFGLPGRVDDPAWAVHYLGLETIRSLVLSIGVFSTFHNKCMIGYSIEEVERHCVRVGSLAREILIESQAPAHRCNEAFTSGLLHDVGKLILASNLPDVYSEVLLRTKETQGDLFRAEMDLIGVTQEQIGAYLLALWGLPDSVVEAVALHSQPGASPCRELGPLAAVCAASLLDKHESLERHMEYFQECGVAESLGRWSEIAGVIQASGAKQ